MSWFVRDAVLTSVIRALEPRYVKNPQEVLRLQLLGQDSIFNFSGADKMYITEIMSLLEIVQGEADPSMLDQFCSLLKLTPTQELLLAINLALSSTRYHEVSIVLLQQRIAAFQGKWLSSEPSQPRKSVPDSVIISLLRWAKN